MRLRTVRFLIAAAFLAACPALVHGQWITFTDMTSTYLSFPGYATDDSEKDFRLADLDNDGDLDLVDVRKQACGDGRARTC